VLDDDAKLTPGAPAVAADVQALRESGFGDRAILDIALIKACFAFVDRVAVGLGLQLEEHWEQAQD